MTKKKLRGVNRLLKTIGEPPLINEGDYSLSHEAQLADTQIDETTSKVLSKGFKFNTVKNFKLTPDMNNYIAVPPNILVITFNDTNLTVNDGMIFNRDTLSFKFTSAIEATIIYNEDFDYIPHVVQEMILAEASYIFQRDVINDPNTNIELLRSKSDATKELNIWHINQTKANGKDTRFDRTSNPVR